MTQSSNRNDLARCSDPKEQIRNEYDELRGIANARMKEERGCHTLTATALVHEVAAKMLKAPQSPPTDRQKFLAFASKAMRNYLVDYARTRGREKRGGDRNREPLVDAPVEDSPENRLADVVERSLDRLEEFDSRKAAVVRLRFMEEKSLEEVATILQTSLATVKRDLIVARAWLATEVRRAAE